MGMQTADVLEALRRLPMRPSAATQVLRVLDDPTAGAREVATALQCDPALCARMLHLANSPYFGLAGKVGSVERAVTALGAGVVRSLAVGTAAGLFGERPEEMPAGFWRHAVGVAAGASIVARLAHVAPGDALCTGLMHDLGVALLYRVDPDGYRALGAGATDAAAFLAAEAEAYEGHHAVVGAFALDAWNLPAEMVDAIRAHHDAPASISPRLGRVLAAGEALAVTAGSPAAGGGESAFAPEPEPDVARAFAALGLTAVSVENLVRRTAEEAEALDAVLGAVH